MKRAFAPHLAGRMLPGLFSTMPFAKKARFPGDPWPTFAHSPTWFWMHNTGCDAGLYRDRPMRHQRSEIEPDWISVPQTPSPQAAGNDRPSVGSMGARQPADVGPPEGQRQLFEATA